MIGIILPELIISRAQGKIYFSQQVHIMKLVSATKTRTHRKSKGIFSSSNFSFKNPGGYRVVTTVSSVSTMSVMISRTVNGK